MGSEERQQLALRRGWQAVESSRAQPWLRVLDHRTKLAQFEPGKKIESREIAFTRMLNGSEIGLVIVGSRAGRTGIGTCNVFDSDQTSNAALLAFERAMNSKYAMGGVGADFGMIIWMKNDGHQAEYTQAFFVSPAKETLSAKDFAGLRLSRDFVEELNF